MENEFPAACCGINLLGQTLKADIPAMKLGNPLNEVFEGAAKPVKPPDNEGIPVPDVVERFSKPLALRLYATYRIGEDFQAAGRSERVLLEMQVLFGGGDAGVSDECHSPIVSKLTE